MLIELFLTEFIRKSPSLRGRGLKSLLLSLCSTSTSSPSLRGRGLKSAEAKNLKEIFGVALFTRAWIEIFCRPPVSPQYHSRPLYEGVDWNTSITGNKGLWQSRPLYEGVDWNFDRKSNVTRTRVALFTRAWIEINALTKGVNHNLVALFTRAWIEISVPFVYPSTAERRPLYEGVDWNIPFISTLSHL